MIRRGISSTWQNPACMWVIWCAHTHKMQSPNPEHFYACRGRTPEVAIRPIPKIPNTMGQNSRSSPRKQRSWQNIINAAAIAIASPTTNCSMKQVLLFIADDPKSSRMSSPKSVVSCWRLSSRILETPLQWRRCGVRESAILLGSDR